MALVRIEKELITDIANAIRGQYDKNLAEGSDPYTKDTYPLTPRQMASAIVSLPVSWTVSEGAPEKLLNWTGDCRYKCARTGWNWVMEDYGALIATEDITNMENMFDRNNAIDIIPFTLNLEANTVVSAKEMFISASSLEEAPNIKGCLGNMNNMFLYCRRLKTIPDSWVTDIDWESRSASTSVTDSNVKGIFSSCNSLRYLPEGLAAKLYDNSSDTSSSLYGGAHTMFHSCYALAGIVGFRGPNAALTTNRFTETFDFCGRLARLVFDMDNGAPRVEQWRNQVINLSVDVGYCSLGDDFLTTYAGFDSTTNKVTDDSSYQSLKYSADWYTCDPDYSRYNHASAVETINSLPDTSAYGTNTIKFYGAAGAKTDGGAINTLTEEEIAVATAKGWTVAFV